MNKLFLVLLLVLSIFVGFRILRHAPEKPPEQLALKPAEAETNYWTCSMHPQIHSDKPGECPICHMKLIPVKEQHSHATHEENNENRAAVNLSEDQLKAIGVQKTTVETMDLTAHIAVSGRFLSPSTIAFQVYESDLRYVRPGLAFTGESSFVPEAKISGNISSVDSIVDPTSRTVRVIGQMKIGPRNIIAETTFRGDIAISLKEVVAIPESSVLHSGNGDLVYMVHEGDQLMAMPVRLGLKTESYYEVLEGLQAGDTISSGPNFLIDSEAKIRGAGSSGHTHH